MMKPSLKSLNLIFSLVLASMSALCCSSLVFADEDPAAVLQGWLNQAKAKKGMAVLLDYVDWDSAFADLPEHEKKATNVNSAGEYRVRQESFFKDPGRFIAEQVKMHQVSSDETSPEELERRAEEIVKISTAQIERQNAQIGRSDFVVSRVTSVGEKTLLEFTITTAGVTEARQASMIKKAGKWYLTALPNLVVLIQGVDSSMGEGTAVAGPAN